MNKQKKIKIPKSKKSVERRSATAYAYIKPINKRWLEGQAKSLGLNKISPTLDYLLDRLRESNPAK